VTMPTLKLLNFEMHLHVEVIVPLLVEQFGAIFVRARVNLRLSTRITRLYRHLRLRNSS